jgi:putative transposase
VLIWRLSNSLSAELCIVAVEEALASDNRPVILNMNQSFRFASRGSAELLKTSGTQISMGGRG